MGYPTKGTGARPPSSTTLRPLRGGAEDMVNWRMIAVRRFLAMGSAGQVGQGVDGIGTTVTPSDGSWYGQPSNLTGKEMALQLEKFLYWQFLYLIEGNL